MPTVQVRYIVNDVGAAITFLLLPSWFPRSDGPIAFFLPCFHAANYVWCSASREVDLVVVKPYLMES